MKYAMCPNCGRRLCKGEPGTKVEISTQQKLNTLNKYLGEELPKLVELQELAKK